MQIVKYSVQYVRCWFTNASKSTLVHEHYATVSENKNTIRNTEMEILSDGFGVNWLLYSSQGNSRVSEDSPEPGT